MRSRAGALARWCARDEGRCDAQAAHVAGAAQADLALRAGDERLALPQRTLAARQAVGRLQLARLQNAVQHCRVLGGDVPAATTLRRAPSAGRRARRGHGGQNARLRARRAPP